MLSECINESILSSKWSQKFCAVVLILCLTALTAELLPEIEAKLIVIPALVLAIFILIAEMKKERNNIQNTISKQLILDAYNFYLSYNIIKISLLE